MRKSSCVYFFGGKGEGALPMDNKLCIVYSIYAHVSARIDLYKSIIMIHYWCFVYLYMGDSELECPVRHAKFGNIIQPGDHSIKTQKQWSYVLLSYRVHGKVI